jgi:electron-transferring-flavoprotein dehydrogenase
MLRRISFLTARDQVRCDLCVVGAGPSGLSAAIRYKQLRPQAEVLVLERGVELGAHILSGAVLETRALEELLPHWQSTGAPIRTKVEQERLLLLRPDRASEVPSSLIPAALSNAHNYLVSLGDLVVWLGEQAKAMGIHVVAGFPVNELLISSRGYLSGVVTGAAGKTKDFYQDSGFQPSFDIEAKQTIFAEGSNGQLSDRLIKNFKLRSVFDMERESCEPSYGLGLKESWIIPNLPPGLCFHTFYHPLNDNSFGYGFLYTREEGKVDIGFVLGLDYRNPYLDPFETFQEWKRHPEIRALLQGGKCVGFGAKTINMGGLYSLPKVSFPGGALVGCGAGFFNPAKGKGIHTGMKSGMLAAEAISFLGEKTEGLDPNRYNHLLRHSWVFSTQLWEELHNSREFRTCFYNSTTWGLIRTYLGHTILQGRRGRYLIKPRGHACSDSERTQWPDKSTKVKYKDPDGVVTFSKEESWAKSGAVITQGAKPLLEVTDSDSSFKSLRDFEGMETRICPTGVFSLSASGDLAISPSRCLLCKACQVKVPGEYIKLHNPEAGEGPH